MPKITLIYIDAGGGHRAAATALREVIRQQQRPWGVEMLCIQDLLDPIDIIRKSTGIPFQDVYNIMLRRGWTLCSAQLIRLMHLIIRVLHNSQVKVLERFWASHRTDLVVSLIPHYNRALREALRLASPDTPFVTLLTDIADYPPHFWIEEQDQYVICGSERSVGQALDLRVPKHRILQTSGMIVSPKFYGRMNLDRRAERLKLGLDPDLPVGLVLFGGEGSTEMIGIARALNRAESGIQLILLCGRNERVAEKLQAMDWRIPMLIEGFTRDIPFYMELSDFFIGKPGPGCISEALVKRLPLILQSNAWTMAHERYNAEWVKQRGLGLVVDNYSTQIFDAVRTLLAAENYARFRQRAAAIRNSAVYEIPDLLENILSNADGVRGPEKVEVQLPS